MSRILLVEDSALQRRAISGLLRTESRSVDVVTNGREAIDYLSRQQPDVIVSDIEMPDMNGLDLVRQIHDQFPRIPVVLITAHGTEEQAVEALRVGAASFVPKDEVRNLLPETIDSLLSRVAAERTYDDLIACATGASFDFQLDNDPGLIQPLVDLLLQMSASICRLDENNRLRVGVAISQAVHNGMFRGNLEIPGPASIAAGEPPIDVETRRREPPYRDRTIDIHAEITTDTVSCSVRDSGRGFDPSATHRSADSGELSTGQGRGLVLMRAFMDEVTFNDRGNEVVLRRAAPPPAKPPVKGPSAQEAQSPTGRRPKALVTLMPIEPGPSFDIQQTRIVIGRDRTCDVIINWPDVSAHHCQLFLFGGWWYVKDLHTKNGVKLNGLAVTRKRINPGDVLSVAKHRYEVRYDPGELGAVGVTPPPDPF